MSGGEARPRERRGIGMGYNNYALRFLSHCVCLIEYNIYDNYLIIVSLSWFHLKKKKLQTLAI